MGEGGAIERYEKERWGRKGDFDVASLSIKLKVLYLFTQLFVSRLCMRKISRGGEG